MFQLPRDSLLQVRKLYKSKAIDMGHLPAGLRSRSFYWGERPYLVVATPWCIVALFHGDYAGALSLQRCWSSIWFGNAVAVGATFGNGNSIGAILAWHFNRSYIWYDDAVIHFEMAMFGNGDSVRAMFGDCNSFESMLGF